MGKKRDPLAASLEAAETARKAFLEKHPDYPETGRITKQLAATGKAPEQAPAKAESKIKPVLKGAAANDFRQRKLLGDDFE